MDTDQIMHTLTRIATEAGAIAMQHFGASEDVQIKEDGSPLSQADIAVNTYIGMALAKDTPYEQILSEESASTPSGDTYWVVDPIDGTDNFIKGNDAFAVSIALMKEGVPVLGVVHAPALGMTYAARVGTGATYNGKPIHASECGELSEANIFLDHGLHTRTINFHESVRNSLIESEAIAKPLECASLELCSVASGASDGMIHRGLNVWDIAAGVLIAQEAGAHVTDLTGNKKNLLDSGIIASSPSIHPLLATITTEALDAEQSAA